MKITENFSEVFTKIVFSIIILQLLYISTCIEKPTEYLIPKMLEYAAASCTANVAAGMLIDYCYYTYENKK